MKKLIIALVLAVPVLSFHSCTKEEFKNNVVDQTQGQELYYKLMESNTQEDDFARLSNEEQAAVWQYKLEDFLTHADLNKKQRTTILKMQEEMTPSLFESLSSKSTSANAIKKEKQFQDELGEKLSYALFSSIENRYHSPKALSANGLSTTSGKGLTSGLPNMSSGWREECRSDCFWDKPYSDSPAEYVRIITYQYFSWGRPTDYYFDRVVAC